MFNGFSSRISSLLKFVFSQSQYCFVLFCCADEVLVLSNPKLDCQLKCQ